MNLVVFTAQMGDQTYEVQSPTVVDPKARYVCFSDQRRSVPPYEWILVAPSSEPMLTARRLKILADHPILANADVVLWHDASYRLSQDVTWVPAALAKHGSDLVAMAHPKRHQIEAEAMVIARYGYLSQDEAQAHVKRYRSEGFTKNILTCTGLLARRCSAKVSAFNALWWAEAQQWGGRDQGSVNYAAWKTGVAVRHVRGTIQENAYASWRLPGALAVPA